MLHSKLEIHGQEQSDHAYLSRLGGDFVRHPEHDEGVDETLRFPEHPAIVVRRCADPKMVKRSLYAAHPDDLPWPDFCDVAGDGGCYVGEALGPRRVTETMIEKWRRA